MFKQLKSKVGAMTLAATTMLFPGSYAGENWAVIIASSCGYDNYRH